MNEIVELIVDVQHQRMRIVRANIDENTFQENGLNDVFLRAANIVITQVDSFQVGFAINECQRLFVNICGDGEAVCAHGPQPYDMNPTVGIYPFADVMHDVAGGPPKVLL